MIKNYLHTNISKSKENKVSDASLLRLNVGKKITNCGLQFILFFVFSFASYNKLFAQACSAGSPPQETFTSTCVWTCPSGVTSVQVECWGGGGGGGGGSAATDGAGGGGGGAYSKGTVTVVPGNTYTITVGSGGAGGNTTPTNGSAGGDSWFWTASTVMAKGGLGGLKQTSTGGAGSAGGQASSGYGTTKYDGGAGGNGNDDGAGRGGGGGSSAGTATNGNNGTSAVVGTNGVGGTAPTGGGAGGDGQYSANGSSATTVGGGGGGSGENFTGGSGFRGQVILTYNGDAYTTTGTWTCPSGVTTVTVQCTGGGGGGGADGITNGGGGGGGGAYSRSVLSVTPGTIYTVTVGAGGGGHTGNGDGTAGGDSWFNTSATILAKGGTGGKGNNAGTTAAGGASGSCIGDVKYSGGTGAGNSGNSGGGGGSSAGSAAIGGNGSGTTGGTAPTGGGNGGSATGGNGAAGASPGGGGGGSTENFYGGNGANGQVLISYVPCNTAYTLTSASGTNAQTVCNNSAIVNITYSINNSATGATLTGGPAGVSLGFSGGIATISGTPTAAGTFNYTVTASGACVGTPATGSIVVNALPATPGNPTSDSPQCSDVGVTLTKNGAAPGGETWWWQGTTSGGTSTANNATSTYNAASTGTYYIRSRNNTTLCWSAQASVAITVNTIPATPGTPTSNSPQCAGTGVTLTKNGAAPGGETWYWQGTTSNGTSTASNATSTYNAASSGTYYIRSRNDATACWSTQASLAVTVNALPAITGQPSNQNVNAGAGTAVFTVTATGGSITYQWQEYIAGWINVSNGGVYSGATTASLSITNPTAGMNGYKYRCVVSGCAPDATSDGNATLTVNTGGNANPCYGSTQNYNVTNVAGVTYNWTFPSGWSQTSGGTTNSVNVLVGVNSGSVTVTPSNCNGNGTIRQLAVSVTSVSIAASATTICSGTSVTFTATPVNAGTPTYQWTKNGVDISGETASTYVSTTIANTDAIAVKMTSTSGCLITSTPINMVVNPSGLTASVSISASETSICSGVGVTFTAVPVNGGTSPSYQWKVDGGNVGTNSSTYTTTTLANTNTVTVVMTNSTACIVGSPATSNEIVMSVNTSLTASATIAPSPAGTICGGSSVTFTATPANGGTPTYQWRNGASNVGTNSNTYTSTTLANNDAIYVLMTTSLPCTSPSPVSSNTITMVVNTPIVNNTVSAAQVICTGSTPAALTGTTPTGGNGAYTYLWEESTTSSTAGFASAAGTNTNAGYSPGALIATTWYRRTVTSAPCASNVSDAIKITVNANIANNTVSSAQSICSGSTPLPIAGSLPTGGNGVYTYVWALSTTSSTAGFGGSIATTQDFSPGPLAANTWYRRTVSSAPCGSSTSDAIEIFINSDIPASVSISSTATSICNGTSVVFTPTPSNGGAAPTYQWTKNGSNITGEVFSTYTSSTLADADQIRVVMTSNASPCLTGSPATSAPVTMTVNEIPIATATNNAQTKCSGVALTAMVLGTSNAVTGTTFTWARDNGDVASGVVTGIAASASGIAIGGDISGTLTNTTNAPVTVTFTITPTGPANTNCAGTPITATVLVNPGTPATPGTIAGIANTYAGFTEPYSIDAVAGATSYTWAVPTGWSISSGQGSIAIKAVAGTAGQNGDITVTATNACGTSAAYTLPVTVTAHTTASTNICEGTTQRYTTQYREGVTYTWAVPGDWTITSGAGTNSILVTVGATSGNVEVTLSNSCGDATDQTLAITANPLPVMTSSGSANTCSGVALNIPLTANPASNFSWEAYDNATSTGESDSPQTAATIADVITTTATTIDTVIYSVIPTSAAGCVGGGTAGSLDPQLITVRVNPSNHWTGAAGDRKWRTAGNWCVVPTCTSDAFIPTSPTGGNYPQVEWPDAICKDLTISTGATLELLSNNLALCGNWLNNGTFTPATYKVTFQGSANQTVGGSVAANTFYDLQISNSGASGSDNVTLSKPATVTNVLNLSNGILVTSATNLLTLTNTANTATNAGNSGSYVSGPMRWNGLNGAGPFIFPTGKGSTKWARIAIQDLTAATDFQAEYFNTSFANVSPSYMATNPTPVLSNVSEKEYWNFTRESGTGDGKLTLYWEDAAWSGITDCSEDGPLQIAHWDPTNSGGKWENNNPDDDIGAGSTCGGSTDGSITTTNVVTEFSPFTFGNDDPLVNPLPVDLLYFKANYNGKTVDVKWQTASEVNNDYFTVERSMDGVNFITVGVIVPSQAKGGNSSSTLSYYLNDDGVVPGVYYYRLKQTDFNGEYKYSNIDMVEIKGNTEFSFNIAPNPSDGTELNSIITAEKDQEIVIVVYDVLGQEIYSKIVVTEQKGNTVYAIDLLQKLSSGVYMITATSNQKVYSKRLVVN